MFDLELGDIINLQRFYRRAPKKFHAAQNMTVNDFAFGTRMEIIKTISGEMTVRNERFVKGSVRVLKATGRRPESRVGSIARPRFSGWAEQQTGERRESTRVATLAGRGKNIAKQVMKPARLKGGMALPKARGKRKTAALLRQLKKRKYKKAFLLSGGGFTPGAYRILRKKPVLVQLLESRKAQPGRLDWMGISTRRYFRSNDPRKTFAKKIKRVMR